MAAPVVREIPDLLTALQRHLKLLREYAIRAFDNGDEDYLGEVAGKLRVLVYERGRNKPLLLSLMDTFGVKIPIKLRKVHTSRVDPYKAGEKVSLRQFLEMTVYAFSDPGRETKVTRMDLIGLWAQKLGAAHEDWELPEKWIWIDHIDFLTLSAAGRPKGGFPSERALRTVTQVVLWVGLQFSRRITPKVWKEAIKKRLASVGADQLSRVDRWTLRTPGRTRQKP